MLFELSLKVKWELSRQKKMRKRLVQRPSKEEELEQVGILLKMEKERVEETNEAREINNGRYSCRNRFGSVEQWPLLLTLGRLTWVEREGSDWLGFRMGGR